FEVIEVQTGLALHDADAHRGYEVADRDHTQKVALDGFLQRQVEGDEPTRDRSRARAAIGLEHVAVHHDRSLSHKRHIDGGSQRTADQALDLLGAAVDPPRPRFACSARLRRPWQHRVFGGDPAFPRPLLMWWRLVVPARG